MKTCLTLVAALGALASVASAEKLISELVTARNVLDTTDRTVQCITVSGHPAGTWQQYPLTITTECCDWFVSLCGNPHLDSILQITDPGNTTTYAFDDDSRCTYPCNYGPAELGSVHGDGCLAPGDYLLWVGVYIGGYYDSNCFGTNDPFDYTLCFDFCGGGTADTQDQPVSFELGDAFPNPFNPSTTINFSLAETAEASLKVFNVAGAEVASLVNGVTAAGEHNVTFDASNLTSGVYFYTLDVAGVVETRKMILVK